MNPGPLDGIRVVDLTTARSGPTCVRQLVDFGAEAIHIGAPGRADLGGSDGWNLRRGTRSIELDLRKPMHFDVLLRLIDRADGFVENFRPAVKYRLGLVHVLEVRARVPFPKVALSAGRRQFGHTRPNCDSLHQLPTK